MLQQLIALGFFTLQAFILVAALLLMFAGILAIATKNKAKQKQQLRIRKLNERYEETLDKMEAEILDKKARKAKNKEEKKQKKLEKAANNTSQKSKLPIAQKRVFVIDFQGDLKASAVEALREEITAILLIAQTTDEVLVKIDSPGGVVHGYGLAASELQRVKNQHIPLIASVDKVAASGGYLMACVADRIIAAPFAIIGSIGVVAQTPNFHRLLKKHDIDFEQITAGEYKRTISLFGEITNKGREKAQEDVEEAHRLFKEFIHMHRPTVDIPQVATGEYWFATRAKELALVDSILTSDEYLMQAVKEAEIFEISYKKKKGLMDKVLHEISTRASLRTL
jgi:serine protease SohB